MKTYAILAAVVACLLAIWALSIYEKKDRYQGLVIGYEKTTYSGNTERDDAVYVLDTHTGDIRRKK